MSITPGTPLEHDAHIRKNGYGSASITYLWDHRGSVLLEICDDCFCVTAFCEHEKNSWDKDGIKLTCDLCGLDGT